MRRAPWAWTVVGVAIAVVVTSWVLGMYSFVALTSPWFNPKRAIESIRESTPRLFVTDDRNSQLYDYCEGAAKAIRSGRVEDARKLIGKASKMDPGNPLFDYLLARVAVADNDSDSALKFIKSGNSKGKLAIYASSRVRPDRWSRTEVGEISHLVRLIVKVKSDLNALIPLFDVGQKLVFCQPADYSVVSYGLFIRRFVATRITAADKGRLTPEARDYFKGVSQHTGPAWTLYDDRSGLSITDPRSKLYVAMFRRSRSGNMKDFVEAYILNKDLEAARTSEFVKRRVKPRPAKVFRSPQRQ